MIAGRIPGCRQFKQVAANEYEVLLKVGIGAISGTYGGKVSLTDLDEQDSRPGWGEISPSDGSGELILSARGNHSQ